MKILFSTPAELDLTGSASELKDLKLGIERLTLGGNTIHEVTCESGFDPSPYDGSIPSLKIQVSEGPAKVSVDGNASLMISGSQENLSAFGSFLDIPAGQHCHFEYHPGNKWVHPDSLPLVINASKSET